MFGKNNNQTRDLKQAGKAGMTAINAITEICGVMVSEAPIEQSLARIAAITADTMGAKGCSVMFYDKTTMELSIKAALGAAADADKKISINSEYDVSAMAVRGKSVQTSAGKKVHKPILPGTREFADIKSMISAPIMINGEPVGVINTYDSEGREFTENEKMAIEAIAAQSAVAIQLAKFRQEAEEAKEALKNRKIIEKAKGILMGRKHITEENAYRIMRQKSMDTGKPMLEVAEALILTDEISAGI